MDFLILIPFLLPLRKTFLLPLRKVSITDKNTFHTLYPNYKNKITGSLIGLRTSLYKLVFGDRLGKNIVFIVLSS